MKTIFTLNIHLLILVWLFSAPVAAQHARSGAPAAATGLQTQVGPYHVGVVTDPAVVPVGRASLHILVKDAAGKPVEGAQVRAITAMPGMPMGETEQAGQPQTGAPGVYVMTASFPMAGGYVATIKISGPQGEGSGTISLQTGQDTGATGGGRASKYWLWWLAGLGLMAFAFYRIRRTGQHVPVRAMFNRSLLSGLAVLTLMLAATVFAVNHFRRPGAMTPLEAQGMEMSMPAPPGSLAVELATVRRGSVQSRVRYTGQAVGYVEQDVNSRVTGNLLWMPFYAGSRVRRGQLLARLDTSQIEPQIAQQRAAQAMAEQNAISAQGSYRRALADVSRTRAELAARRGTLAEAVAQERKARAEVGSRLGQLAQARSQERKARSTAGGRGGAVAEARSQEQGARAALREATAAARAATGAASEAQSDLVAAREDKSNAEAELDSAQTEVSDAQAQLEAALADQEYWAKEIERMRVLLKEGAVSREEFQREQAQAVNADTMVHHAHNEIVQKQAAVRGAESRIRRADAMIASAQARAVQADAATGGSQARIEQAQANIVGAGARVRQMQAESQGAGADISGAGARIRQMEADVQAARAEAAGASARVQQVSAEIEAAEAGIRGAQAQAATAGGGIGQAEAGVEQARAAVAATITTSGYAAIHALVDGVVSQRLISPGTLVQPGQAILKIAQVDPIRLQANVAETDLQRVRVGSAVKVLLLDAAERVVMARVTSLSPVVDPQTRTGLVEVIVPNKNNSFKPGQFVEMEIETGQSRSSLSVPAAAVQRLAAPTGSAATTRTQSYVWVAEAQSGQPGRYTVRQTPVQTGVSNGSQVEVLSGLSEGEQVVTLGYQSLHEGDTVTGPAANGVEAGVPARHNVQTAQVAVFADGYRPASLTLKAGVPARIIFTRKDDIGCGTEVVLPQYNIKKALPLNKPVSVEFTPRKGEFAFTCGMNMLRGRVVVQ